MIVTIPDELAAQYLSYCRPNQTLDQLLEVQLRQFANCNPKERTLVLPADVRRKLEEVMGQTVTAENVVTLANRLASIHFGHIRVNFTHAQLAELKSRCERQGLDPKTYTHRVVQRILESFFDFVAEKDLPAPPPAARVRPA